MEMWLNQLTAADVHLGLAGQKAAIPSLLLATVQSRLSGGLCRWQTLSL